MNRPSPNLSPNLSLNLASTLVFAALLAAGASAWAQPAPSEASIAAHVAAAKQAAGTDLRPLASLCAPAPATRPTAGESEKYIEAMMSRPAPFPGKAFDNLYFVGANWVSAWAIKTSDGIILIDALNNQAEASALIERGLAPLGLNPAQIKYIIVTHGHGDHYGGVRYLVDRYQPRVVMSERDWKMTETKLEFESPHWDAPPKRNTGDMAVHDGDTLRLGDTVVTLYLTPGHTMGTITPVFDVKSGGTTHRAMLWGGTSFNFGKDIPRLDAYIEATQRLAKFVGEQHIDVLISNHSGFDDSLAKLDALRNQPGLDPNPFVIGTPAVERALTVMGECAQAQRDRFLLQP